MNVPAIVDEETFQKACAVLQQPSPGEIVRHEYLLGGRMTCECCGANYYGVSRKSGQHKYYWCGRSRTHLPKDDRCGNRRIAASVEERVWNAIADLFNTPGAIEAAISTTQKPEVMEQSSITIQSLKARLSTLKEEGDRTARAMRRGTASEECADRMLGEIEAEERETRLEIANLEASANKRHLMHGLGRRIATQASWGRRKLQSMSFAEQQELLDLLSARLFVPPEGDLSLELELPFEDSIKELSQIVPLETACQRHLLRVPVTPR
ncbi:MAG: recombinase zinc ribbon domain-containing protein [Actinomycetota bacterium]